MDNTPKSDKQAQQEHKPITLTPGIWEVGRVREHDWISGITRRVQD